jgi:hypothetical protein
MPKYYVTYDRTYLINANDSIDAIDNAELNGEQIAEDIFVEEADNE